jgi:hypothetical protein
MLRRFLIGLLTLAFIGCGARHHALQTFAAYREAVLHNDIPAFVRLADPNMRNLIELHNFTKEESVVVADQLLAHPIRVFTTQHGVAYLGWIEHENRWHLWQLVIGKGRVISAYSAMRISTPNTTTDWQVSMLCSQSWELRSVRTPEQRQLTEQALAKVPDDLFVTWYFTGSTDAQLAILKQLPLY